MFDKGLHAGEIECLVSRFMLSISQGNSRTRWLGVFARDELPDLALENKPLALVLNTDPHDKPGQHWLAIYAPTEGPYELFDSFGLSPSFYALDFLEPTHSLHSLQSYSSSLCGHYCIYFIYLRSRGHSFHGIIEYLVRLYSTDRYIHEYINELCNRYQTLNPCHRKGQCSKIKCSFCYF